MNTVRCSICRQQLPTLKSLQKHLIAGHSKTQIIKELLQNSVLNTTPNIIWQKHHGKHKIKSNTTEETNSLNLHKNVEMEFTIIDETSSESKENYFKPLTINKNIENNNNTTLVTRRKLKTENVKLTYKKLLGINNTEKVIGTEKKKSKNIKGTKRLNNKIVVKEQILETKIKNADCDTNKTLQELPVDKNTSLNDKTGEFYKCKCMEKVDDEDVCFVKSYDLNNLGSDTESSSDNGKNGLLLDNRIYCNSCGNSYSTKEKLMQHLEMHKIQCKVCYRMFSAPHLFREHVKQHLIKIFACYICNKEFLTKNKLTEHLNLHFEHETFENILDMEQVYITDKSCTNYYNYCYDYFKKINFIVSYLNQNNSYYVVEDAYNDFNTNNFICSYDNNGMFTKTICNFCFSELEVCEYGNHLKSFHQYQF